MIARNWCAGLAGIMLSGCATLIPSGDESLSGYLSRDPGNWQWGMSPSTDGVPMPRLGLSLLPSHHWHDISYQHQLALFYGLKERLEAAGLVQEVVFIPPNFIRGDARFTSIEAIAKHYQLSQLALVEVEPEQVALYRPGQDDTEMDQLVWQLVARHLAPREERMTQVNLDISVLDIAAQSVLFTAEGDGDLLPPEGEEPNLEAMEQQTFGVALNRMIADLDQQLRVVQPEDSEAQNLASSN